MEKKIIVLLIIISFLIGLGIGTVFERGIWYWQLKLTQNQEEIDSLKSQLEILFPPLSEEVYNVSGIVTEVGDKFLIVEAQIRVSQFPLPEGKDFETRSIKVNVVEKTEIFGIIMIENPSSMEEPFEKINLDLKDIEIKDNIMASSEENIKDKREITAKEIQVVKYGVSYSY